MERDGVVSFRQRGSPSSDRFLGVFSPPASETFAETDDELEEDDVFWTGDFAEKNRRPSDDQNHSRNLSFRQPEKSGILAALTDENRRLSRSVLYRKPAILSSSSPIPAVPKVPAGREQNWSQSMPARKLQQSAPVNVPLAPARARRGNRLACADSDLDEDEEEEMMPPHEIVARGSRSPKTTFSMLEGAGRTLKGRDLRQDFLLNVSSYVAVEPHLAYGKLFPRVPNKIRSRQVFLSCSWGKNPRVDRNHFSIPELRGGGKKSELSTKCIERFVRRDSINGWDQVYGRVQCHIQIKGRLKAS
ncbi:hypothetical protein RJ639_035941 [Escallonia herrerae]|uniref:Uncharacterized protein n=1 Tax=Escallonia herrerae TaxID=1293975 RepID=A0AA89BHK8_9ASTE|nr:hypothetical protein RJ639_035941 [Escallonia herrerae]